MAEITKVKRCYHCGVNLQTEDPNKEGYISSEVMKTFPNGILLCNHCYQNERFNSTPRESNFEDGYESVLSEIVHKNALAVYVIDLFSFEGSFISKFTEHLNNVDVLVVANKFDLLPKGSDTEAIKEYVSHRLRVAKLNVKDVILTSSIDNYNVELMMYKIIEFAQGRDVYFVGASQSGKSALISDFLKFYKNPTKTPITTCTFAGTKLRGFKIPITSKNFIYETPGFILDNSILNLVEKPVKNLIIPKKAIVPQRIRIGKDQALMIGGLAAIQLISEERVNVDAYFNDKVTKVIVREPEKELKELKKKKAYNPVSERYTLLTDFDAYEIKINETTQRDIGILGLGWISFVGKEQVFRIYVPKGVFVYSTRGKIKNANK